MKKLIAVFNRLNLTKRLILYFSVIIALQMILIGWFNFSWISSYLKKDQIKKMLEINNVLLQEVNQIRISGENLSDRFLFNESLQELLSKTYTDAPIYEVYNDINDLEDLLTDPTGELNIIIVGENQNVYQSRGSIYPTLGYEQMTESIVYQKSLSSDGRNVWIAAKEDIMDLSEKPFLYLCRTLNSHTKFNPLGQLIIQIPFNTLNAVFKSSGADSGEYYLIVDKSGRCIYSTLDIGAIGQKIDDSILAVMTGETEGYETIHNCNTDYLVTYSKFEKNGWDIVHMLPMNVIISSAREVLDSILLFMFIPLIVLIPLQIYLSRNISQPIKSLNSSVKEFGEGKLNTRTQINRMDEIGDLQSSFNTMAIDINNLVEKVAEEHRLLRLMELDMIESQINPHFLYNSLDSINWMAQKAGNKDIEEMVTALARFFRVGLSKGKESIRIKDELDHVRQYLLINKIRFKDSYNFEVECEPEILNCYTIKIILQPIVENAIKYGINKKATEGYIKVAARKDGDTIVFEIKDNGIGIPADRFSSIQNVLSKRNLVDEYSVNGFGLFNVNQRICLHYGNNYGITLESEYGQGTTVYLRIPLMKNSGERR